MTQFGDELATFLGGCKGSRIFPLGLRALSEHLGIDFVQRYEDEVEGPVHTQVPRAFAEQFSRDVDVYGICQALLELAQAGLPAGAHAAVKRIAHTYLGRIRSPWDASLSGLAADDNPRVQELLQAISVYNGEDLSNPPGIRRAWQPPSTAEDEAEQLRFSQDPLQVPPHPDLGDMVSSVVIHSEGGAQRATMSFRGTVTTAVEYIGSYWMFEGAPQSEDLPFQLAFELQSLGLNPLGTLAEKVTRELLALRRAQAFGDHGEMVDCSLCSNDVSSLDAESVRRAMHAGAWVCAAHTESS